MTDLTIGVAPTARRRESAQPDTKELVVGIDLGTTNSLVAYMDRGVPLVVRDAEGRGLVPSVVAFGPAGSVVGDPARRMLVRHAERAVYSVKRFMGKGFEDVRDELRYFPFQVTPSQEIVRIRIGDRELTPPEVSALVLRELRTRAERHLGRPVEKAVITVPAYFNDAQRQATKDAGRIAGLDVLRIVNEPTAACLAYGLQRRKEGVIAVYDLGGGTFDVSILKVKDGIFEVLATNGDTHLGGDDFDRALVDLVVGELRARHGIDVAGEPETLQEIRLGVEAARILLSSDERTTLTLPLPQHGLTYRRELTRAELESVIDPIVARTLGPCRAAIADSGLSLERIDEVVLVGGATRTPAREAAGAGAVRPGAPLRAEPRRGRGPRGRRPGGHPRRRDDPHAPARRHAAVARNRDAGRRGERPDPAEHDDPDVRQRGVHDLGRRAVGGGHARGPGGAGPGQGQSKPGPVRPDGASRPCRRACRASR